MPSHAPYFDIAPTSGPVGTGIDLRGHNYDAQGQPGVVTFDGVEAGHFTVQANRTWNDAIWIPTGTAPGAYSVVATAGDQTASATFTVTA